MDIQGWLALGAIVVALIAIPIAVWATRRWGNRRARLVVASVATPLLPAAGLGLLQVTFRDVPVDDPHLVSVTLRNAGPRDIASEAFDRDHSIEVRFDRVFFGVTWATEGVDLVAPAIGEKDHAIVQVGPGLLKRGESWSFDALTSGPVKVTFDVPLIDTDVEVQQSLDPRTKVVMRILENALGALVLPVSIPSGLFSGRG